MPTRIVQGKRSAFSPRSSHPAQWSTPGRHDNAMSPPSPVYSGHLLKLGSNDRWQSRLFTFDGSVLLCLGKKPQAPTAPVITTYDPHVSSPFMSPSCQLQPMSNKTKWFINMSSVTSIKLLPPSKTFRCFPYAHSTRAISIQTSYGKTLLLRARKESEIDRWFFVLYKMWVLQYQRQAGAEGECGGGDGSGMDQGLGSPMLNSQLSAQQQSMNLYQKYLQKQYQLGAQHLRSMQQQQNQQMREAEQENQGVQQTRRSQRKEDEDDEEDEGDVEDVEGEEDDDNSKDHDHGGGVEPSYQLPAPRISAFLPQGLDWPDNSEGQEEGDLPIILSSSVQDLINAAVASNEGDNSVHNHKAGSRDNQSPSPSNPGRTKPPTTPQHSNAQHQALSSPSRLGQPMPRTLLDGSSDPHVGHMGGPLLEPSKAALIDQWRRSLVTPVFLHEAAADGCSEGGYEQGREEGAASCDNRKQEAFGQPQESASMLRPCSMFLGKSKVIDAEEDGKKSRWFFSKSEYFHPRQPPRRDSVSSSESSVEDDDCPRPKSSAQQQRRGLSPNHPSSKLQQQQQRASERLVQQLVVQSSSLSNGDQAVSSATNRKDELPMSNLQRQSVLRLRPQAALSDGDSDGKSAQNDPDHVQSIHSSSQDPHTLLLSEPIALERSGLSLPPPPPAHPFVTMQEIVATTVANPSLGLQPLHAFSSLTANSQVGPPRRNSERSGSMPLPSSVMPEIGLGISAPGISDTYTLSTSRRPSRTLRVDTGPFTVARSNHAASQNGGHSPNSASIPVTSATSSSSFHTAERGLPSPYPSQQQPNADQPSFSNHSTNDQQQPGHHQSQSPFLLTAPFQPRDAEFPPPGALSAPSTQDERRISTAGALTAPQQKSRVPQLSMESQYASPSMTRQSSAMSSSRDDGGEGQEDEDDDDDKPLAHTLTRQWSHQSFYASQSFLQHSPLTPLTPAGENAPPLRRISPPLSGAGTSSTTGTRMKQQPLLQHHPELKVITHQQQHATPPLTSASSQHHQLPLPATARSSPSFHDRPQPQQSVRASHGDAMAEPMESFSYF